MGLYDTVRNVWEWCSDWHGEYPTGSVTDSAGPGSGSLSVFRRGAVGLSDAGYVRSANWDAGGEIKLDREEQIVRSCRELDGKHLRIDEPFEVQDVWWERGSCWCWELRDV